MKSPLEMNNNDLSKAIAAVSSRVGLKPRVGLILGSGLGGLADQLDGAVAIPYGDIPGFPCTTVPGHQGRLVIGLLENVQVAAMQGRVHLYEGYTPAQVGYPVRLLHALGVQILIVTNASGGLRTDLEPGALLVLEDHINLPGLTGLNPLVGTSDGRERFVNMTSAYDEDLRTRAMEIGRRAGLNVESGVYAMVMGPSYETPAEARFLLQIGADAVGMSTVPEVVVARSLGMRVLAISCVTDVLLNPQARWTGGHEEVLSVAERSAAGLTTIVRGVLRSISLDG